MNKHYPTVLRFIIPVIILVLSAALFSSCTSAYRTGQTPDDVYYSPLRPALQARNSDDDQADRREDRLIRMGMNNPRYRYIDNTFGWGNFDPYNTGWNTWNCNPNFNYGWNNWNYYPLNYYHPIFNPYPVLFSPQKNSTPRTVNLAGYGGSYNNGNVNHSIKYGNTQRPSRDYNNSNNRGRSFFNVDGGSGRSYNSGSSSGSSQSSGSSSGGGRPARGGGNF